MYNKKVLENREKFLHWYINKFSKSISYGKNCSSMILQLQKLLTNISKTVDLKLRNNFLCEIPGNHPRIIQISKPSLKKCNFSFSFKTSALTDIENEKRVQAQIKDPIHLIYQQFFFLSMFSLTINHDLQDSRGRGGLSLWFLFTASTCSTGT